jgi:alpha-tubulin suppressor-like RCC1 family protein
MTHHNLPRIRALLSASLLSFAGALFGLFVSANASAQRYVAISAGLDHSCGVRETGEVFCWGSNSGGQLGDGSFTPSAIPVRVAGLEPATAVSVGIRHTCAIVSGGKVKCWGEGTTGQLGNASSISSLMPVEVSGITTATAIESGDFHACALLTGGSVRCWGSDFHGSLGNDAATASSNVPVAVALGANNATVLSVGADHACVRRSTGAVACWGKNSAGQIGDGSSGTDRPMPFDLPGVTSATTVTAGESHSCLALTSGAVQCWGRGTVGQLGTASTSSAVPRTATGVSNVTQMALGDAHTCARLGDGTVACWGFNTSGQLGREGDNSFSPTLVSGLTTIAQISAGASHNCALRASGELLCWGRGRSGQLGTGGSLQSNTATTVLGLTNAASVTVGMTDGFALANFACARRSDSGVVCWGSNGLGQLGNGTNAQSGTPVPVSGITNAAEIKAGNGFACARLADATVKCWGDNSVGQLGNGGGANRNTPVSVSGLADVAQVAVGAAHACARRNDGGSVVCWGANSSGQLGDGTTTSRSTPVAVTGITNATDIAAGESHTCARLATNAIVCWGDNISGQLGNGNTGTDSSVPVFVTGATSIVSGAAIAVGNAHACVRTSSATLACWGRGNSGQLGVGTLSDSNVPVAINTFTTASGRPALGARHSCSIKTPGNTVVCWGNNRSGELGDGLSPTDSRTPIDVFGVANAVSLAAGGSNTCAVISGGTVRCWGSNEGGVLANGAAAPPSSVFVPTRIASTDSVCSLDIDGNGTIDALTDMLVMSRARFGLSGTAVTDNAIGAGATRSDWSSIRHYLQFNCNLSELAP